MKKIFGLMIFCLMLMTLSFTVLGNVAIAADKPMRIIVGHFDPETSPWAPSIKEWAKELEEKAKGKVKVEFSWAGALGHAGEFYDLVSKNICDAGFDIPSFGGPGLYPMTEIVGLPFNTTSGELTARAMLKMKEKGYLGKEYTKVNLMHLMCGNGEMLLMKDTPVTKVEHVKGKKIWAITPTSMAKVKGLGGTPVALPPPDIYPALQKGVIDGLLLEWAVVDVFKLQNIIKYVTNMGYGTVMCTVYMNKKTFAKLPPEAQAMIDGTKAKYSRAHARGWDLACDRGKKLFLDAGGKILDWESGEMAKIHKAFAPMWENWIAGAEKKGLPARAAVNDMYNFMKELGVDPPAIGYAPK